LNNERIKINNIEIELIVTNRKSFNNSDFLKISKRDRNDSEF